jgi:hypothetical protein
MNLFYEQPDNDRWVVFDRYPRRVIRRFVRGKRRPGGHDLVFLNLRKGLDRLGICYRVNDYRHLRRHPEEVACVIGKPHVVDKIPAQTPILFGTAQFSHPDEQPGFFPQHQNIRKILVPGEWVRQMWEPYFGNNVAAWPVGIDSEAWRPRKNLKDVEFLLYDKLYRPGVDFQAELVAPIVKCLNARGASFHKLRYGNYTDEEFSGLLDRTRAMIFLCEHETQGIAYQQALASGVPILAYDRGGLWTDPNFFPHIAKFSPVSSVPYWDARCGIKFTSAEDFEAKVDEFIRKRHDFDPRGYILENLTLEKCAARYLEFVAEVQSTG